MSEIITSLNDNGNIEITPEMQKIILENWSKKKLDEVVRMCFNDESLDGRSKQGRAVRDWIVKNGLKVKTSKVEKKGEMELTEAHTDFIMQNSENMTAMEMARVLFPEKKITPLHGEFIAIQKYLKSISPDLVSETEQVAEGEYEAPKSIYRIIPKVNKYVGKLQLEDAKLLDPKTINDRDIKNLRALIGYMNTHSFLSTINIYEKEYERTLFESRFIRYVYNKPDLLEEEVDQYVAICDKAVALFQLKKQIQVLQKRINMSFDTDDTAKQKLATNDINLLESYRERETASEKWIETVLDKLVGSRDARLKGRNQENASILNFLEAFQSEKKRKEILELFKRHKMAEAAAVKNLSSMDAVVALVAGYDEDDARFE